MLFDAGGRVFLLSPEFSDRIFWTLSLILYMYEGLSVVLALSIQQIDIPSSLWCLRFQVRTFEQFLVIDSLSLISDHLLGHIFL